RRPSSPRSTPRARQPAGWRRASPKRRRWRRGRGRWSLRLQRLLLGRREEDIVEDEAVSRRVGVQRQVGGRGTDAVLRVLRIVSAQVGPAPLAVVAVDVLHPGRALLVS